MLVEVWPSVHGPPVATDHGGRLYSGRMREDEVVFGGYELYWRVEAVKRMAVGVLDSSCPFSVGRPNVGLLLVDEGLEASMEEVVLRVGSGRQS